MYNPNYKIIDAIKLLVKSNIANFDIFQITAVCLSAFTCLELFLSFKNPFYPGKRRMKFYLVGTIIITFIMVFNLASMLASPNDAFERYELPFIYLSSDYQDRFIKDPIQKIADINPEMNERLKNIIDTLSSKLYEERNEIGNE